MPKATVLSVDDDAGLQTVVQQYLEDDGYKVLTALSGAELKDKLSVSGIEVVLLDLVLPDAEGLGLIAEIRNMTDARIIIVSGKSDTTEKIVGLEMGADDYITKPFEMRELAARIKAVLRRNGHGGDDAKKKESGKQADKIRFGNWVLDRTQYQLFHVTAKETANLTTGEFKLLEALVMAPNRALSRELLFELTRENDYDVYDRAIDIQIARIRKKLAKDPESEGLIKTVRGVGYMFCGEAVISTAP